jgi:hypothetical protein
VRRRLTPSLRDGGRRARWWAAARATGRTTTISGSCSESESAARLSRGGTGGEARDGDAGAGAAGASRVGVGVVCGTRGGERRRGLHRGIDDLGPQMRGGEREKGREEEMRED